MESHSHETGPTPATETYPAGIAVTVSPQEAFILLGANTEAPSPTPLESLQAAEAARAKRLGEFMTACAKLDDKDLRLKPKPKEEEMPLELHKPDGSIDWGKAASQGKSYSNSEGFWPETRREHRQARRAYDEKMHLGTLTAKLSNITNDVYDINAETGRSAWRGEDDTLDHLPWSMQRSIKKSEKLYLRTREEKEHAEHLLGHFGEKGIKRKLFIEGTKKKAERARQASGNLDRAFGRKVWKRIDVLKQAHHQGLDGTSKNEGIVQRPIDYLARKSGKGLARTKKGYNTRKRAWHKRQAENRRGVV